MTCLVVYKNCLNSTVRLHENCNFILDQNFWTRNVRKSIKGSKDSDSSPVSNENFSETLWPSGWILGQATWAKMTLKLLYLRRHSQKIRNPQPKIFF